MGVRSGARCETEHGDFNHGENRHGEIENLGDIYLVEKGQLRRPGAARRGSRMHWLDMGATGLSTPRRLIAD